MKDHVATHFEHSPPAKFAKLSPFTKKKKLLKYVHDTVFEIRDLMGIILGSHALGYTHCVDFASNDISHLHLPKGITGENFPP